MDMPPVSWLPGTTVIDLRQLAVLVLDRPIVERRAYDRSPARVRRQLLDLLDRVKQQPRRGATGRRRSSPHRSLIFADPSAVLGQKPRHPGRQGAICAQ